MFVDFGCCILRMALTANKFTYSKSLSIEEFLFAYRTFYVFGFIREVFWKLSFYVLSLCVISLEKPKKPRVFWRFDITINSLAEERFEMYTLYRNP